jgi:hypothetical protein
VGNRRDGTFFDRACAAIAVLIWQLFVLVYEQFCSDLWCLVLSRLYLLVLFFTKYLNMLVHRWFVWYQLNPLVTLVSLTSLNWAFSVVFLTRLHSMCYRIIKCTKLHGHWTCDFLDNELHKIIWYIAKVVGNVLAENSFNSHKTLVATNWNLVSRFQEICRHTMNHELEVLTRYI